MAQANLGTLDPDNTSGTELATKLENAEAALHSLHKGDVRPSYAAAGMLWVKEVSATQWDLMWYDGDADVRVAQINPTSNAVIPLPVASGGTGAGTAAAARTNLGLDNAMLGNAANTVSVNQAWTAQIKVTYAASHALWGVSTDGNGIRGESTNGHGVFGKTSDANDAGVRGDNHNASAWGGLGFGVYGVYSSGPMFATGGITSQGVVQGSDVQATSDRALKTEIEAIGGALARLDELAGVTFRWRKGGTRASGLIAQDVQGVLPEAVGKTKDGHLTVSPLGVIGLLVEAVKELSHRVAELEER